MGGHRPPNWGQYFGAAEGGGAEHHYHLTINTSASTEPILADFQLMQALAGF
jgi:hypothetical protein